MTDSNIYGPPRVLVDSDYHRVGSHLIQPFYGAQVQPASYDIRLGNKLLLPKTHTEIGSYEEPPFLDLRRVNPGDLMYPTEMLDTGFVLERGKAVLAASEEQVACPNDMICSVEGKSTIARCFISIHQTAGFVDPGYCGAITLEIVNFGPWNFVLYPGMLIAQLRFHWLGVAAMRPYGSPGLGSHYQGSVSVRAADATKRDR